ncbi:hypothetical protein EPN42_14290 [bacterium]|nr:MAG: hypothetical protein EPN42_14290 [bacterium]
MKKRDDIQRICASLRDVVNPLFEGEAKVYYGPEIAKSKEPEVLRLRRQRAHFYWVAVPLGSFSFWELHAGAVVNPDTLRVRLGIHCLASARPACEAFESLKTLCRAQGLEAYYSEAAGESQYVSSEYLAEGPEAVRSIAAGLYKLYDLATKSLFVA